MSCLVLLTLLTWVLDKTNWRGAMLEDGWVWDERSGWGDGGLPSVGVGWGGLPGTV